jgi:hypothetical protein
MDNSHLWLTHTPLPSLSRSTYNVFFKHQRVKLLLGEDLPTQGDASETSAAAQWDVNRRRQNPKPHRRISFSQLGTLIGKQWSELSDEDKVVYKVEADRDKERYMAEKQRYLQAPTNKSAEEEDEDLKMPADESKDSAPTNKSAEEEDDRT